MPKGEPVFRVGGGGGKIFKNNEKGFFLNTNKGGKLLETVVSTLV